jgi:hypothetical protein
MTLAELAEAIRVALKQQATGIKKEDVGRKQWIDATMALAQHLLEAREQCGKNDNQFGVWLSENKIKIYHGDRAALIAAARNPERMREALEQSSSHRLRTILKGPERRYERKCVDVDYVFKLIAHWPGDRLTLLRTAIDGLIETHNERSDEAHFLH